MPGSTLARRGATGGYVIAYAVTLASFIVIWFNHPILLYIGRDANLSLWLNKAYADWAYPLDVTAMNPFQGMTSMLMPINPYFNPGTWIFQTALPEVPKRVISFIVYFVEVTASAFLLGVALGFSRLFAFVGALWLAFLLFPPFNFVYGLQGWLATNPPYGHTLALSNLILVAFIRIGAESPTAARPRTPARAQLAACELHRSPGPADRSRRAFLQWRHAGRDVSAHRRDFPVIAIRSQMLWRLAAGVYVLACCAALGFSGFFAGAQAYSARFSGVDRPLLQFHWPVEFSPEPDRRRAPGIVRVGRGLRSHGAMAARAHRIILAAGEHHRGSHRGRDPHASAARARRSAVCGALDRSAGGLDRRKSRNHRPRFRCRRSISS